MPNHGWQNATVCPMRNGLLVNTQNKYGIKYSLIIELFRGNDHGRLTNPIRIMTDQIKNTMTQKTLNIFIGTSLNKEEQLEIKGGNLIHEEVMEI
ncbi:MAG: hypothetical protein AAFZ15_22815 [Bacteroidota bacterium]